LPSPKRRIFEFALIPILKNWNRVSLKMNA